jgi:predicted GTPase
MSFELLKKTVVTGADGMGKSQLISNLISPPFSLHYLGHEGGPIESASDAALRLLSFAISPPGLLDRCCAVDDPIYSTAFDRQAQVDWNFYSDFLQEVDPLIIFVDNDEPAVCETAKAHKSPQLLAGVQEKAQLIRELYHERIAYLEDDLGLEVFYYNWRVDQTAKKLMRRLYQSQIVLSEEDFPCVD